MRILIILLAVLLVFHKKLLAGAKGLTGIVDLSKSYLGQSNVRGVRNNNPLNLRRSANAWKGKIPHTDSSDTAFEQFVSWVYGLRAGIYNMRTQYQRGKNTIFELVSTWSPVADPGNPAGSTAAYIAFVSNKAGIPPGQQFNWDLPTVTKLVVAMAEMELGSPDYVTQSDVHAAWQIL